MTVTKDNNHNNPLDHASANDDDDSSLSTRRDSYNRYIAFISEEKKQEEFTRLFMQYKMIEPVVERWIRQYGLVQQREEEKAAISMEKDEMVFLDLGCGPGHDTALLCDIIEQSSLDDTKTVKVIGMDLNSDLLKQAMEQYESSYSFLTFQKGSATEIPLPDESVDVVYIKFVLQHISGENRIKVLEEIKRVLKPKKGRVLIVDVDEKKGPFCIPEPIDDGFQTALDLYQKKMQALGENANDRQVVRKLPVLLRQVGFPVVRVRMDSVVGGNTNEEFSAKDVFQTFYTWKFIFLNRFSGDEEERRNIATWLESTLKMVEHPEAILTYPIFLVLAEA